MATTPKPKPKPPPDDPTQSTRFIETAKKVEADESGKEFMRAFKKIVPKSLRKNRNTRSA